MRFRNLVDQAKSFINSPQGRRTMDGVSRAARQRGGRPRGGTAGRGRSSGVDRAMGLAQRFLRGRGGRPGGGTPRY